MRTLLPLLCLTLLGCVATGDSDSSHIRELTRNSTAASPVKARIVLPSVLRRPALVTQERDRVTIHDLERWSAPLDEAIGRDLSSLLADAPVQDVLVRVQQLEVSRSGNLRLAFAAEFSLVGNDGRRITTLYSNGLVVDDDKPRAAASFAPVVAAYAQVPVALAKSIRQSLAQQQAGVANPPAPVTVPAK